MHPQYSSDMVWFASYWLWQTQSKQNTSASLEADKLVSSVGSNFQNHPSGVKWFYLGNNDNIVERKPLVTNRKKSCWLLWSAPRQGSLLFPFYCYNWIDNKTGTKQFQCFPGILGMLLCAFTGYDLLFLSFLWSPHICLGKGLLFLIFCEIK